MIRVDFETVRAGLSISKMLEEIGHEFTRTGAGGIDASCPIHKGAVHRFSVSANGRVFCCYNSGGWHSGDIIELARLLHGLDPRAAAEKLATDFNLLDAFRGEGFYSALSEPKER